MTVIAGAIALIAIVIISGGALVFRADGFTTVVGGALVAGGWALLSILTALVFPGPGWAAVTVVALGTGLAGWGMALRRVRRGHGATRSRAISKGTIAAGVALITLPWVATSQTILPARDPFAMIDRTYVPIWHDNTFPSALATAATDDTYRRPLVEDFLGSDRPPLQAGFITLLRPVTAPVVGRTRADFAIGMVVQQMWIVGGALALWALFWSRAAVLGGLLSASLTGVVQFNTVYTWPKLLGAGLFLLSLAMILRHRKRVNHSRSPVPDAVAGLAGGFALQAHGSLAFAVVALIILLPVIHRAAPIRRRLQRVGWFLAGLAVIQVPWTLWQHLADPPGNRLLKWHLAGVIPIDGRGLVASLIDSYKTIGIWGALEHKWANVRALYMIGDPPVSPLTSLSDPVRARQVDFDTIFAQISWSLPLVLVLLTVVAFRQGEGRPDIRRPVIDMVVFTGTTVLVWCLLMFGPGTTTTHLGPLTIGIALPLVLGAACNRVDPTRWCIAVGAQAAAWVWLYVGSTTSEGMVSPSSVMSVLLILTVMLVAFRSRRAEPCVA